jgi:hypothetical protein
MEITAHIFQWLITISETMCSFREECCRIYNSVLAIELAGACVITDLSAEIGASGLVRCLSRRRLLATMFSILPCAPVAVISNTREVNMF